MIHRDCSFQAKLKYIAVVMFHMRCDLVVLFFPFPLFIGLQKRMGAQCFQISAGNAEQQFCGIKPLQHFGFFNRPFPQIPMELN